MKKGCIYIHRNLINGHSYVGSTIQDTRRRWRKEDKTYHSYKSCSVFFAALNKYGWEYFETTILEDNIPFEDISKREEFYIQKYNSIAPNGYNTVKIIDGRVEFTEETKNKISESRKEYYQNLTEPIIAPNRNHHILIENIPHKKCSNCKEIKTLDKYCKYKTTWDGLNRYCKNCASIYSKQYVPEKLSEEELKKTYIDRRDNMIAGLKMKYNNNPELREAQAKRKSKPVFGVHIVTGETIFFDSAMKAKESGFNNTEIGQSIKNKKPYKKYNWFFNKKN